MKQSQQTLQKKILKHSTLVTVLCLLVLIAVNGYVEWYFHGLYNEEETGWIQRQFAIDMQTFELMVAQKQKFYVGAAEQVIDIYQMESKSDALVELLTGRADQMLMAHVFSVDESANVRSEMLLPEQKQTLSAYTRQFIREQSYSHRNGVLYPVGIIQDPKDLRFVYAFYHKSRDGANALWIHIPLDDAMNELALQFYSVDAPLYTWQGTIESVPERRFSLFKSGKDENVLTYRFAQLNEVPFEVTAEIRELSHNSAFEFSNHLVLSLLSLLLAVVLNWRIKRMITSTFVCIDQMEQFLIQGETVGDLVCSERGNSQELSMMRKATDAISGNLDGLMQDRMHLSERLEKTIQTLREKKQTIFQQYQATLAQIDVFASKLQNWKIKQYSTLKTLMSAIELRDSFTRGHCDRVEYFAEIIATRLKLSHLQVEQIKLGALLHDIGKLGVREMTLANGETIHVESYRDHPRIGYQMLESSDFSETVKRIVLEHHEHMDGTGYPQGLQGDDIHYLSRIIAVADAYDTMTSGRPNQKRTLTRHEAIESLQKDAGTVYDTEVVRVMIQYLISEEQGS